MAKSVRDRLADAMQAGSKAEKAIAAFIDGALADIPFETAASLAAKVGVSEATIGRFCRAIGYQHFRDLKDHLKADIGSHPWLISDRLDEFHAATGDDESALARGLELEIAGLVAIYEQARTDTWKRVAKRLASSKRVFVAGFQTERGIAQYFANQLHYLRKDVQLVDLAAGNFAEILASDEECCLVVFEARRYSRQAKVLAEDARAAKIPVTLMTDIYCDWGPEASDEMFTIPTEFNQFWDSTALLANLGNLLINSVFMELGPEVEERLNRTAELFGRFTGHVGNPISRIAK